MSRAPESRLVVPPGEGAAIPIGDGLGAVFKIAAEQAGGALTVLEHPVEPGVLVMPHVHQREDEYSFVIEGEIGVRIGDRTATAPAGSYVMKPRGMPHTFWNAGPEPARVLEIIAPAGFEQFFIDAVALAEQSVPPDDERWQELGQRYGLTFLDDWVAELEARHGVRAV